MTAGTVPLYQALGLTADEYGRIERTLDREPTHAELAMFSVMWSEHCSYKSSRVHLKELPTTAAWVVAGPGENAGVVQAAPGLQIAFKIESHNHPSAVEPFQGAATGVGGIVRDILALGARPVALMDPLRFGSLDDARTRYLFDGVVRGIANYGNSLGLPVVGGEAVFDPSYAGNPLVNVMCVGVVEGDLLRSAPGGAGQVALLFGSRTGRDGIGGASILASRELEEGDAKRPSVQVGDPFTEKLLIEACLDMKRVGILSGLQDLGAAGLTCALTETAAAAGLGIDSDLDRVPLRERDMEPWEILMSESQERMLACIDPSRVDEAIRTCERWGLDATVVGRYTDGGRLVVRSAGSPIADVPAVALSEGLVYDRPHDEPVRDEGPDPLTLSWPGDLAAVLMDVLASPSIASKRWVWRQYDHMVRLNALTEPGADGAVLRLPEADDRTTQTGIVMSCDGPGRIASLDPYAGGALAVCEAARNVACMGARPLAVTNCLNFGSPERSEVMWSFARAVRGLADACNAFGVPVTGGNVSFYNESPEGSVHPTPVVGMLGVIDDAYAHRPAAPRPGQTLVLLGETRPELGGSEALAVVHGLSSGRAPALDLGAEVRLCRLLGSRVGGWAHDCSDGGLWTTLAEACIQSGSGLRVDVPGGAEPLWWLLSESTARAVVACDDPEAVMKAAAEADVPAMVLGSLTGAQLEVSGAIAVRVDELVRVYEGAIPSRMEP